MRTSALLVAVLVLAGCDAEPALLAIPDEPDVGRLQPRDSPDAGTRGGVDCGVAVAEADGGVRDDAGGGGITVSSPDAGVQPSCLTQGAAFPFSCEGDEDYCEPSSDVALPAQDIVAAWSHFEGDVFVVDLRFRAMPFTVYRSVLRFFVDPNPFDGTSGHAQYSFITNDDGSSSFDPPFLSSGLEIAIASSLDDPTFYPPSPGGPTTYPPVDGFDWCDSIFLAIDQPHLQLRLPFGDADLASYFAVSSRGFGGMPGPGGPSDPDYLFTGTSPAALRSLSGRPDLIPSLLSLCSVTCTDIGGSTQ